MRFVKSLLIALSLASSVEAFDLTSLISHWKLDEASGNALDAHGSNTLTDTNTVTAATGKVNGARDFEADNAEYFTIADNAALSTGDIDFAVVGWFQLESKTTTRVLVGKTTDFAANANWEYLLYYSSSLDRFRWGISNGTVAGLVAADNLGSPSAATWYFIVCWHDATANTVNIQVNNGTANTTAVATGSFNSTHPFRIGAFGNASSPHDGLSDEVSLWKRILTTDEKTFLYNGGAGRAYPWSATSAVPVILQQHSQLIPRSKSSTRKQETCYALSP